MESGFNVSTNIPRVSLVTEKKIERILGIMGKRNCVVYSEEMGAYYKDGEWVKDGMDATIGSFSKMFEDTRELPLTLRLIYLMIKI